MSGGCMAHLHSVALTMQYRMVQFRAKTINLAAT